MPSPNKKKMPSPNKNDITDINLTREMKRWVNHTERIIKAIKNKISSNSLNNQTGNLGINYNQLENDKQAHPLNARLAQAKLELERAKSNLKIILDANLKFKQTLGGSKRKSNKKSNKQSKKVKSRKNKK